MSSALRTTLPSPGVTRHTIRVCLAVKDGMPRSLLEDKLVPDGFEVRGFHPAAA